MNIRPIVILILLMANMKAYAQIPSFDFNANMDVVQTVNGTFPIVDFGSGPAVLLLHGFPDSKELWSYQIRALADAGYRVLAPDLRGYGNAPSPLEKEQYAIPILMADVIGILDALSLDKVHLVGHDWGAALSWQLARYYAQRFYSMTVLSVGTPGSTAWDSWEQREKSWYFYLFLQEGLAEKTIADNDWELCNAMLSSHKRHEEVLKNLQKPNALTTALNWYRGNLQNIIAREGVEYVVSNTKESPSLDKIKIPVLGIWSDGDSFLLEQQMLFSANFTENFTYKKIKNAGHWMMLDKPNVLNAMILKFISDFSVKE